VFDQSTLLKLEAALDEMLTKRAEHARKLMAADEHIANLRQLISGMLSLSQGSEQRDEGEGAASPREDVKVIRNTAYQIFEQRGQEMDREELHQALLDRGVVVGGKDILGNLSAHLSHDDRFAPVKGKRGYWTLKKWANSLANEQYRANAVRVEPGVIHPFRPANLRANQLPVMGNPPHPVFVGVPIQAIPNSETEPPSSEG